MSSHRSDPRLAAEHLAEAIGAPSDTAVSISTCFRPGKPLALKVFIAPEFKYLVSKVPNRLDGYEVLHEVASRVRAI